MNLLAEALSSAEDVEIDEINKKVPELTLLIENLKSEVMRYIENVFIKYSGRPKRNKICVNKIHELEEKIKVLKTNAESVIKKELNESLEELKQHVSSLEGINFALRILSNLCHINESLINYKELLSANMYYDCMQLICNLQQLVKQIPEDECIDVLDEIKITINTEKNILLNELTNLFTDNICITGKEDEKYVVIKVKKDSSHLEQALLALYSKDSVIYPLHNFAKSLWDHVFVPIVDSTVNIDIDDDDRYNILKVSTVDPTKRLEYTDVFTNLKTVLEFLNQHCNIKINEELTSLGYIGLDIRDNLSELIIKNCLQHTIPSNAEELQKYKVVIEHTKSLEEALKNCRIFAEDTTSILEYANNVDILFINKKCNEYISTARSIMKKDLHDMVEVGTPYNPNNPLGCNIDEFLQCSISKSTLELLQFAEKIIKQTVAASDVCAGRLLHTVQNIFRMYGNFVPEYHKKLLQTIPQQVALFHNNCLYIAFKLTQWNQEYTPQVAPVLKTNHCVFKDEMLQLQTVAFETFTAYVDGQLKQINEIMSECGLGGSTLENVEPVTEKSVRQCLRQQELLKTVWQKVLSYPTYNKTLGVILNSLCSAIINVVVKFEDISCGAAEQLVEIFKVIFARGPKLFTDPKEVSLYVASWYKMNELNFVLGAGLLDIDDRWADGKGPLAMQFQPCELKQLIRALFQNTDRRSAILAKIQG